MKIDLSPCEISDLFNIFSGLKLYDLPHISKAQVSYFRDKFDTLMSEISD